MRPVGNNTKYLVGSKYSSCIVEINKNPCFWLWNQSSTKKEVGAWTKPYSYSATAASGWRALSGFKITPSMRPYSLASLALMKKSRSVSWLIFSRLWPVWYAKYPFKFALWCNISFACNKEHWGLRSDFHLKKGYQEVLLSDWICNITDLQHNQVGHDITESLNQNVRQPSKSYPIRVSISVTHSSNHKVRVSGLVLLHIS